MVVAILPIYRQAIMKGIKTIEGRPATEKYREIALGDEIVFQDEHGVTRCIVENKHLFKSFHALLTECGYLRCIPHAKNFEEALEIYLSFPGYSEKEAKWGAIAFQIKTVAP